jgi:hypothetical protein
MLLQDEKGFLEIVGRFWKIPFLKKCLSIVEAFEKRGGVSISKTF